MPFKTDQVVSFHYTVKDETGTVVDSSRDTKPLAFLSGKKQILPKIEEELGSMLINSKKVIELTAAEAYGEFNEEAVQKATRSNFPEDAKLEVGMEFMAQMENSNPMPFVIKSIEGDDITIDFNHPLAGKALTFDVELMDIRDASAEELAHGHVHGPEGHNH